MSDDCDFFQCDTCKKRLKVPVVLRNGKKICKGHLNPDFNEFTIDIKFNNYLNAIEYIENVLNKIQSVCNDYRNKTENFSKNLDESLNKKKRIYEKIHYINLNQELKHLNTEYSKYKESITKIINDNKLDCKEIDKYVSDFKCQLNLVSAVKKVNQIMNEVTAKYNEINAKTNATTNIRLSEPKLNITLQTNDMIIKGPLVITCCCLDRLKPVIYLGSDTGHIIIYDFFKNNKIIKEAHTEKINSIDINHENTLLASCSSDKLINIWLLENYTILETLNRHRKSVKLIKFSPYIDMHPDQRHLRWFASTEEKFLRLWKYDTNKFEINHVKDFNEESNVHAEILHVSFSSGGAILAAIVSDFSIIIYSLITENKEAEFEFIDRSNNTSKICKNQKNNEKKAIFKLEFENVPNEIRFLKEFDNSNLRIVKYKLDEWYSYELSNSDEPNSKINLITFKWNCNDTLIFVGIAAESYSIRIIDAKTRNKLEECPQLIDPGLNKLTKIEPHPTKPNIFATLNETGTFIIWDIISNDHIRYKNETSNAMAVIKWSLQHPFILLISKTSLVYLFKIEDEENFNLKNTENSLISVSSDNERNYILREFYNAKSIKKSEKIKNLKSISADANKELGKKRRCTSKRQDTNEIVQGETILKNLSKKNAEYDTSEDEEIP